MRVCFYAASYPSQPIKRVPLGISYLMEALRSVPSVTDCTCAMTVEEAVKFNPDIFCVSSTSQVINDAIVAAESVYAVSRAYCILGGYHVSAMPHRLPDIFDAGVIGEGEKTIVELVSRPRLEWNLIPGTCGRSWVRTDRPSRLKAHEIPIPHRDRFGNGKEFMFTSRGCPFKCVYCASSKNWGKAIYMPAEQVVNEMNVLVNDYGAKHITLLDDLFSYSTSRLVDIVDLMKRSGILGKVTFNGFVRANLVTFEMARLMKLMGFTSVRFGAETMGPDLLKFLKKDTAIPEDAERAVDIFSSHSIPVGVSFVFGTPGETESDLEATFQFLKKNRKKAQISGFYLLTPYPGTELWDIAVAQGLVDECMDWSRLSLDMLKPEFNWDDAIYMNDSIIPLGRFKQIIKRFKKTFL